MKRKYILLIIILLSFLSETKAVSYYFYVQFKDKNNSPYSLSNPSAYLSQRALNRRAFFNIALDSADLPVNPNYVAQIQALNLTVHCRTKWMNGITITTNDSSLVAPVRKLSFVKFVQFTGETSASTGTLVPREKSRQETVSFNYGTAATQINMLNGSALHDKGYRGQGIYIAVIDAGFNNADKNAGFDSLRAEGRLLGVKNVVNPNVSVYSENAHGAYVLSIMAGNMQDKYLGTAPKASYLLLQSEANNTETLAEPDFWISAIEYADSVGVDVSTTSLGYTHFDNAAMNFTYADMNGKKARASIAATMAVDKGIIVLNAAGNDGVSAWHYIGVPADADKIITVGSVDYNGVSASSSSYGPSSDGRVKPELCAMGANAALISTSGSTITGSGTSFATPVLAGMTACFLQAVKEKKPTLSISEIKDIMYRSANLYSAPTAQKGYGIPNFQTAYNSLINLATQNTRYNDDIKISVNTQKNILVVKYKENTSQHGTVKIYTSTGELIVEKPFTTPEFSINITSFPAGIYILNLNVEKKTVSKKIIINR